MEHELIDAIREITARYQQGGEANRKTNYVDLDMVLNILLEIAERATDKMDARDR